MDLTKYFGKSSAKPASTPPSKSKGKSDASVPSEATPSPHKALVSPLKLQPLSPIFIDLEQPIEIDTPQSTQPTSQVTVPVTIVASESTVAAKTETVVDKSAPALPPSSNEAEPIALSEVKNVDKDGDLVMEDAPQVSEAAVLSSTQVVEMKTGVEDDESQQQVQSQVQSESQPSSSAPAEPSERSQSAEPLSSPLAPAPTATQSSQAQAQAQSQSQSQAQAQAQAQAEADTTTPSRKRKRDDSDSHQAEAEAEAEGAAGESEADSGESASRLVKGDSDFVVSASMGAQGGGGQDQDHGTGGTPVKKKKRRMSVEERTAWEEQKKAEKAKREAEELRRKEERERVLKEKAEEKKRKEEEKVAERKRKEEERAAEKKRKEEDHEAEKKRKEEEKAAEKKRKEEEKEAERKKKEEDKEADRKRKEEERAQRQREKEEEDKERKRKEDEALAHTKSIKSFFAPSTPKATKEAVTVVSPTLAATISVTPGADLPSHALALASASVPASSSSDALSVPATFYHAIGTFKAELRPSECILIDFHRPPLADVASFERALSSEPSSAPSSATLLSEHVSTWRAVRQSRVCRLSALSSAREKVRGSAYNRNGVVLDLSGASDSQAERIESLLLRTRIKCLTHHDDARPPYLGTFTRTPKQVRARRPWGREAEVDYEEDSGEEWDEELAEGADADAMDLGDDDERDAAEDGGGAGPNEYELDDDSMVVPDDYFSADEGIDAMGSGDEARSAGELMPKEAEGNNEEGAEGDQDEDDDPLLPNLNSKRKADRAAANTASGTNANSNASDTGRAQLSREKLLAKTKASMRRKAERGTAMHARCLGVVWALDSLADDKDKDKDKERRLLAPLTAVVVAKVQTIKTSAEPWQPRAAKTKRAREEGAQGAQGQGGGEERPHKKRALEALTPDLERAVLMAVHGATSLDRVATEVALKHAALSKKRAVATIKEHASYEKREGGGLRKRYYVKAEVATRLEIEAATLEAQLRSVLDKEAQEAQEARAAHLVQQQQQLQQLQQQQLQQHALQQQHQQHQQQQQQQQQMQTLVFPLAVHQPQPQPLPQPQQTAPAPRRMTLVPTALPTSSSVMLVPPPMMMLPPQMQQMLPLQMQQMADMQQQMAQQMAQHEHQQRQMQMQAMMGVMRGFSVPTAPWSASLLPQSLQQPLSQPQPFTQPQLQSQPQPQVTRITPTLIAAPLTTPAPVPIAAPVPAPTSPNKDSPAKKVAAASPITHFFTKVAAPDA